MTYIWLIIIVILSIIEFATINLTTIWFVISGIVSLIISFFSDNLSLQVGVFVIFGIILLLLTRKFLARLIPKKQVKTNLDRIIGMKGIVTNKDDDTIEVKVDGKKWSAYSDDKLEIGDEVIIREINSVKLKVEKEK